MTQRPTAETKPRQPGRVTPKCLLKWTIDPATGKPAARWTAERAEIVDKATLFEAA